MLLTLPFLMENVEPFDRMSYLAGSGCTAVPILHIGIFEAPDSVDFVQRGEFLLTTGYVFRDFDNLLSVMRRLREIGIACIGIKMDRYLKEIPQDVLDFSNKNGPPIVSVPNDLSWNSIIQPLIQSMEFENEQHVLNGYSQISTSLRQIKSRRQLLKLFGKALDTRIFILGNEGTICERYPDTKENTVSFDADMLSRIRMSPSYQYDHESIYVTDYPDLNHLFCVALDSAGSSEFLIVENRSKISSSSAINYLLHSLVLFKQRYQKLASSGLEFLIENNNVLSAIFLREDHIPEDSIGASSYRPAGCYAPVLCEYTSDTQDRPMSINTGGVISLFHQLFSQYGVLSCVTETGFLFFLLPVKEDSSSNEQILHARKVSREIYNMVGSRYPRMEMQMLIGNGASSPEKLTEMCHQLKQLIINKMLPADTDILHIHDLGILPLFPSPEKMQELGDFYADHFGELSELDKNAQESILQTLIAYIDCGLNYREAAKELSVHHNTVRYRIEQFSSLTGLSLTQSDDLSIILLCLCYYKWLHTH